MSDPSLEAALERAYQHHRAGELAAAERLYREVLARAPDQRDALHHLGLIELQSGHHERAVRLIGRAATETCRDAALLNNLGEAYRCAGDLERAVSCYERALGFDAGHAPAYNNLGMVLGRQGHLEAAIGALERAAALAPGDPGAWANLGDVRARLNRYDGAVEAYGRALALAPGVPALHHALGHALAANGELEAALESYLSACRLDPDSQQCRLSLAGGYLELGQREKARECFDEVLRSDPRHAEALAEMAKLLHHKQDAQAALGYYRRALASAPDAVELRNYYALCLAQAGRLEEAAAALEALVGAHETQIEPRIGLATVYLRLWRLDESERCIREAVRMAPDNETASIWLGFVLVHRGRLEAASDAFLAPVRERRAVGAEAFAADQSFHRTTRTKLRSDMEQLGHLIATGKLPAGMIPLLDQYRRLVDETPKRRDGAFVFEVPQREPLASHYNRLVHEAPEPALPGPAVNEALDFEALEAAYHGNAPGMVCVDDFLSPPALAGLQRFCRDSTMWFQHKFPDEVGARLWDGFCCPLLLQIATELRARFPRIFAAHPLSHCFAYKYFQNDADGHLHADEGAVSVNFWIAPDEANRDPELGGLWIWDRKVPADYFTLSAEEERAVHARLIEDPGTRSMYVPYRCNRAMIFHSNMLHKSHRMRFAEEYAARRVSITFLYGRPSP